MNTPEESSPVEEFIGLCDVLYHTFVIAVAVFLLYLVGCATVFSSQLEQNLLIPAVLVSVLVGLLGAAYHDARILLEYAR